MDQDYNKSPGPPGPPPSAPPPYAANYGPAPTPVFTPAPAGPTMAFVTPTVFVASLGPGPSQIKCSTCNASVVTRTTSNPGAMSWLIGLGLCLVGLWPCSCIPCCISDLNDVTHYCPNCNVFVGKYRGGGC